MVTLDMTKKTRAIRIDETAFSPETGILTLQISLDDYDLTGKTVTATFNETGVETGYLSVVSNVIQLPITTGLVASGTNHIQLNIREGLTLEQSPIMEWYVLEPVTGTDPAPTDVDIITALLNTAQETVERAEAAEAVTGADVLLTAADVVATGEDRAAVEAALSTFTGTTLPAAVAEVEAEGDAQILLVQAEGTTQTGLVTAEGTTQVNRVIAEGDTQEQRVTGEGTTQVGLVQAEGTTQIGLVDDEGDAQILLVQGAGTTQIGLVQAEGTAQIALVQAELPNVRENIAELQTEMRNVEDTLLQLNTSNDAKVTVTAYDTVNSLPKNAAQAGLSVTQSGMTATNLTDGDFSATGDWTSTFATFTVSNGIASFLANAQNQNAQQPLNAIATHKYYVRAFVKTTTGTTNVAIRFNDGTNTTDTATASSTAWQKVSAIITAGASGIGYVGIIDKRAASWDTIQVEKFKTVNLTAIAQQALTLTQADAMLIDYFSGTQSAVTGRIRSVGKNLFDGQLEIGAFSTANGSKTSASNFVRSVNLITIDKSKNYIFSTITSFLIRNIFFYDRKGAYINSYLSVTNSNIVELASTNIPVGTVYINFVMRKPDSSAITLSEIDALSNSTMIELGTTATPYEPYKRTEQYCKPIPLRRLPNTIIDDVTNGKHTKRIGDPTSVSGTMFASIDNSTYTNVSVVKTTAFSLATAGTAAIDNSVYYRDKNGVVLQEVASADIDNLASVGKFYYHTDKTVWRILAKGSLDIATARTNLGTETIMYRLATPVITENVTSGSIIAYPQGTIYAEPVIADVAVYSTNAGILNTGYPISTLESIYKIDPVTGEQTPLAVASATVASGGLSFTHTGLVSGDLVFFTYYYSHPYPYGLNSYTYINANGVVLGADGKYYKIGYAIDIAGNISLTKTEVV